LSSYHVSDFIFFHRYHFYREISLFFLFDKNTYNSSISLYNHRYSDFTIPMTYTLKKRERQIRKIGPKLKVVNKKCDYL